MFCKAITTSGTPCVRHVTCGRPYCGAHRRRYQKCPICYEDMQAKKVLACGHTFCVTCLCKCDRACPLCRQETNDFREKVDETLIRIVRKIEMNDALSVEARKVNSTECCDMIMSVHYKIMFMERFRTTFIEKVHDLSAQGMDMGKILKQIASFSSRVMKT